MPAMFSRQLLLRMHLARAIDPKVSPLPLLFLSEKLWPVTMSFVLYLPPEPSPERSQDVFSSHLQNRGSSYEASRCRCAQVLFKD